MGGALRSGCDLAEVLLAVLDNCKQAIKLIDLDGRIMMWNAACEQLYGWSAEEAVGTVLPHYPESIRLGVTHAIRETAAAGASQRRTVDARRKDGSTVGVDMLLLPVRDRLGDPCAVLSLASEVRHDTRFDSMTDEFLAAVAHEMTAPLTALQGAAQLLLNPDVAEDPDRRATVAQVLNERCQQIGNLTQDLLMSTGLLGGGLPLDDQHVDVVAIARQVAERMRAGENAADVTFTAAPPVSDIRGDGVRIEQAISTMLAVALEDSGRGPVVLSAYDDGASVVVETVQPPGEGAPAGGGVPGLDAPGVIGTGARLKLVERIADAHGGSFGAHRPHGGPSSLQLRLPRSIGEECV